MSNTSETTDTDILFNAIRNGDSEKLRQLVKKYNVNARDSCGQHALYIAACQDNPELIRILLEAGADASNAKGFSGRTPLHVVCFRSTFRNVPVNFYTKSVEMLIHAGNSPLDTNMRGIIPLDEMTKISSNGISKAHPDFYKFMQRITQLARQHEQGDVKSIKVQE